MKTREILAAITLLSPTSALAREVWVPEDEHASGVNLYRCNAGIKTAQGESSSTTLSAKVSKWDFAKRDWGPYELRSIVAKTSGQFENLVPVGDEMQYNIKSIQISFGSEKLSTAYRYDYCYRGPQINYFSADATKNVSTNFVLFSEATLTELDSNAGSAVSGRSNYVAAAKPHFRSTVACDRQGDGKFKFAHDGVSAETGVYDTLRSDIDTAAFDLGKQGNSDWFLQSAEMPTPIMSGTSTLLPSSWINYQSSHSPRFCLIRHEVSETTGATRGQGHMSRFLFFNRLEEQEPF